MDLLKEYEFESLPYIDKEYDNPIVADLVHATIASEMRTFVPNEKIYLAYLPYPEIKNKFIKDEISRRMKTSNKSTSSLDTSRYSVTSPLNTALDKDPHTWRQAITNAKAQYINQLNRSMNAEIYNESAIPIWLEYNKYLESINNQIVNQINNKKRKINEIINTRINKQKLVSYELNNYNIRYINSIEKSINISLTNYNIIKSYNSNIQNKLVDELDKYDNEVDSYMDIETTDNELL